MTVELTTQLDDELVRDLRERAASAGIDVDTLIGRVLTADHLAASGTREERIARATALAAAAVHDWNRAGRPEGDGVDFDDLFLR
ncbi:hypothetical protein ACW14Y_41260 [Kitasatospora sp. cg17-2]